MSSSSQSIIFFADNSQETQTLLSRVLLSQPAGSLVALFLNRAQRAIQDELMRLPLIERNILPKYLDLFSLVRQQQEELAHPSLHPLELCLVQLASFIVSYERNPHEPYPESNGNVIIGICTGAIAAAAVSLAKSLTELIPLAVDAVRLAFRIGFATSIVGNELEQWSGTGQSWSVAISRESGISEGDMLENISKRVGTVGRHRPYIASLGRKSITLGGPPSTLKKLLDEIDPAFARTPVNIFSPYHASHLYSHRNVLDILDRPVPLTELVDNTGRTDNTTRVHPNQTFMGGVSGQFYSSTNRRELLESAVFDILTEPIYWENMLDGCKSYVESSKISRWVVRPFGPAGVAKSLASFLKTGGQREIVYDEVFGSSGSKISTTTNSPLAIVGMAGRFPGAENVDELWEILVKGIDCHREIPVDRFDSKTHLSKPAYGCFLEKPGMFDTRFFHMSPREALQTDPGQRLSLVTAYEALEMSGFVPNRTPSTQLERIGTFYGQTTDEYKEQNMAQDVDTYWIPGSLRAFGPGRINHYFKFGGPASSFDTACSSSSVALHAACDSIWNNECDTAVVGGVSILTGSDNFNGLSAGHFLSSTGGCKTFDDKADGYCRGEAVGSVVIKRLDAAQADNDNILTVILSTATNYSAESVSITRPHGPTQENLYRKVLNDAGIRPFDVDYVECHGTGTQAGDTIEMESVTNVFAPKFCPRLADNPLYIGAIKANIGHGESASGITSLIKSILVLRENKLPPHIGIKSGINHKFSNLAKRGLCIPLTLTKLPSSHLRGTRRRALVNNFSAAGGNTAIVLEEPPERISNGFSTDPRPQHIIGVTAKSAYSLQMNIRNLVDYIDRTPNPSLCDLSYTTTACRIQHPLRTSIATSTIPKLRDYLTSCVVNGTYKSPKKLSGVHFVFTGQGSLYSSLGKELFQSSSQFRSDILRFDGISQDHGFPTFLPLVDGRNGDIDLLTPTQAHLGMVSVQMALCRLLRSWGIVPDLVIGHSLGEYSALYASGVLAASDTLFLVGQRGALLEAASKLNTHVMFNVRAAPEVIQNALGAKFDDIEISCINGPQDVVLSGFLDSAKAAETLLKSQGFQCRFLNVPFAFHSSQMDGILKRFEDTAQAVKFMKPILPIASPLLGVVIRDAGIIGPTYLRRHTRECVNFHGALRKCETEGLTDANNVWIEIGPHPICSGMVRETLGDHSQAVPTLQRKENPWITISNTLSCLHMLGCNVNWNEYHRDFEKSHRLLHIPVYKFDEENYWIQYKNDWVLNKRYLSKALAPIPKLKIEPRTTTVQRLVSEETLNNRVSLVFETDLTNPILHAVIVGHLVNGSGLCPASVYADIALTVADYVRRNHKSDVSTTGMDVMEMEILQPIILPKTPPQSPCLLRITADADLVTGTIRIEYSSSSTKALTKMINANCSVLFGDSDEWVRKWSKTSYLVQKRIHDLERESREGMTHRMFRGMIYKLFSSVVHYDQNFQGMQEVLLNSCELELVASVKLYDGRRDSSSFFCSPFWIDNFVQVAGFVMNANDAVDSTNDVYICHRWGSMRLPEAIDPEKMYRVHVKMQPSHKAIFEGDVAIFQGETMVGFIEEVKFQKVPRALLNTLLPPTGLVKLQPGTPKTFKIPKQNDESSTSAAFTTNSQSSFGRTLHTSTVSFAPTTPTVKPNDLAKDIFLIVAEEIGISLSDLSEDSSFSDLGVDSLLSLTITSKLRETLQINLPQAAFQDFITVGELRRYIHSTISCYEGDGTDSQVDSPAMMTPASAGSILPRGPPTLKVRNVDSRIAIFRSILAEQIGIEVEHLPYTENLASLGVDSLMGLSIATLVQEALQISISPDVISGEQSLAEIETLLGFSVASSIRPEIPSKSAVQVPSKTIPLSVILQGNFQTANRNLFLFPDGSGSATCYSQLPSISSHLCVVGLNSTFLRAKAGIDFNIRELVASWVPEIRARQSHGPYSLGGWSAGAYFAFECAKALIAAGEVVEKLLLLDSPPRNKYGPLTSEILDFVSENKIMGDGEAISEWLRDQFVRTLNAVEKYIPSPINDSSRLPETFIIWGASWPSDIDSSSLNLDIPIYRFLLGAREGSWGPLGWEELLSRDLIRIVDTPGNHFSMVKTPNAESLSRLIGDAMKDDPSQRCGNWRRA